MTISTGKTKSLSPLPGIMMLAVYVAELSRHPNSVRSNEMFTTCRPYLHWRLQYPLLLHGLFHEKVFD